VYHLVHPNWHRTVPLLPPAPSFKFGVHQSPDTAAFRPQNSPHLGICTPSNTWFFVPAQNHISRGIWIGSAIFCSANNRNRETDGPTTDGTTNHATPSVATGRIYPMLRCGLIIHIFSKHPQSPYYKVIFAHDGSKDAKSCKVLSLGVSLILLLMLKSSQTPDLH